MADSSSSDPGPARGNDMPGAGLLKTRSIPNALDIPRTLVWAQRTYGRSRLRQLGEMAVLALSRGRLSPKDYCAAALFRPDLSAADRRAYLSDVASARLNARLSPPSRLAQHALFRDKVLTGFVLEKAGFPTPATLAVYSAVTGMPGLTGLRNADELARWLTQDAPFPVFGKPVDGSLGVGGVALLGATAQGLQLGDGRAVPARVLAEEIARHFARGWIIQPLIRVHPDIAALSGPAAAMLRVCTLRTGAGVETLYTAIRLPAKGAMVDSNVGHSANGLALVDPATGALIRAQDMWRMNTAALSHAPATGEPLSGRVIPMVAEACRLSEAVHRLFPAHGVLGFDVALTETGPVMVEVNANPHHLIYQRSADRGLMNPDFLPRLHAAEAESRRLVTAERSDPGRIAGHV